MSICLSYCTVHSFNSFFNKQATTPTTLGARLIQVQCGSGYISLRGRCRKIVTFGS